MKKLSIGICVLVRLVGVLLGVAAMQPDAYSLERSETYDAPPEAVWAIVSDFGRFSAWSPWQKHDPDMKTTVEGKLGTVGHKYTWSGNENAGAGVQTFKAVKPGERIDIDLEFKEPFPGLATTTFVLAKDGGKPA